MDKRTGKPELTVVPMPSKAGEIRVSPPAAHAITSKSNDPRTQEAMRLVEAFLAIEDATARSSLIALAERLVSYDWLRRVQQR
jgi:hypothetical protein